MKKLLAIILCLFLIGCNSDTKNVTKDFNVTLKNQDIEVYSDVYLYELIEDTNAEILTEDTLVNTSSLGKNEYSIKLKYNESIHDYKLEYNVVDQTKPKIFGSTSKTIEINYEKDLCDLVLYGDNYDSNPKCTIEGKYDLSKVGNYSIKLSVSDTSSNNVTHSMKLKVVKKIESKSSSRSKIYFKDALDKYKNDNTELGIDVSAWQNNVDFKKVKNAGATFAMIRIGVQVDREGKLKLDKYYLQNIKNAKEAGLQVGIYLYSKATSVEESKSHALWVLEQLDNISLDLPIVFDWESWSSFNSYDLSFYDINSIADIFIKTINENGYEGVLYSSKNYLETIWENKLNHPVWLAHYTNETSYKGDFFLWQFCDTGRIDGISGDVDLNVLYKKSN